MIASSNSNLSFLSSSFRRLNIYTIALNEVLMHSADNLLRYILRNLHKGKLILNINQANITRRNICLNRNRAYDILNHNLLATANIHKQAHHPRTTAGIA